MGEKLDRLKEGVREVLTGGTTDDDLRARLHADHVAVSDLVDRMIATNDDSMRGDLCAQVVLMLGAHARAEEEVVYRFLHQEALDRGELDAALRDHREIDRCVDEIRRLPVRDATFLDRARELRDAVAHHVHDEESQLLPQAEKDLGRTRLAALIPQFNQRKSDLLAAATRAVERGWHPVPPGASWGLEEQPSEA